MFSNSFRIFKFFGQFFLCFLFLTSFVDHHKLLASQEVYDGEDDDDYEYEYCERTYKSNNGLTSCDCYMHCNCFETSVAWNPLEFFLKNSNSCRNDPDKAWHEFMTGTLLATKKSGPGSIDNFWIEKAITYRSAINIHSLYDYLSAIEKVRQAVDKSCLENREFYKELYAQPAYKGMQERLKEILKSIDKKHKNAHQALDNIPIKIKPIFEKLAKECRHYTPFSVYSRGLIASMNGEWEDAIFEIQNLLASATEKELNGIESEVYQTLGESFLEVHLFHEAINALTAAIQKNPKNKQAYFGRASAYFETGDFDSALKDYLLSDKGKGLPKSIYESSIEFSTALLSNLAKGSAESAIEFIPTTLHSVYGLGQTLWATASHPIESAKDFVNACMEIGDSLYDYCKNLDWETVDGYVDEIKNFYEKYNDLSEAEKGELIGYMVGKYGTDILIGGVVIKGVNKLRTANKVCNLEAMAVSNANKETIVASAVKHSAEREVYFKNVKYNFHAHNKHIVGHNDYQLGKSIWQHKDPEGLLRRYAGTGRPENGIPGQPGFRETVDFKEHIGIWVDKNNKVALPTTRGTIHYGKKGAHIVPANPNPIIGGK